MATREKAIVTRIISLLRRRGAWYLKTCPPNRPGVPDLLVCYRGRFVGIECKNEDGIVSKIQNYELGKIGEAGGISLVARDTETVELWLNSVDSLVATNKQGVEQLDRRDHAVR